MAKDWELFRYREVNDYFWQGLERSEFYCAHPSTLNDPFDCRVDWKSALTRAVQAKGISQKRLRRLKAIREAFEEKDPHLNAGVCCFARDLRSLLMWSHYTRSHQGVCLFYKIPPDYFTTHYEPVPGPYGTSDELYFVGGSQVYYGDDEYTRWLSGGNLNAPLELESVENAVTRMFTSKARDWRYEEEWRMVTSAPGILQFEPKFLKDVTFGLHTSAENKARIAGIARNNNPQVIFRQAMRSTTKDFGLEFVEVVP
jgi:hypothetical protein